MTRDEVTDLARKAGATDVEIKYLVLAYEAGYAHGAEEEREACAKVCQNLDIYPRRLQHTFAYSVRNRLELEKENDRRKST
jgi:hypothetical protein